MENDKKAAPEFVDLLLWVLLACAKRWKGIFTSLLLTVLFSSILVVFVLEEKFESSAIVLPPKGSRSGSLDGLDAITSGLGALSLGSGLLNFNSQETDLLLTIVDSYSFQRSICSHFGLDSVYEIKSGTPYFEADLIKSFRKNFKSSIDDETSFLILSFRDKNPLRAKAIVDDILISLDSAYVDLKTRQAGKTRNFFEARLDMNRHTLDSLKTEMQIFQETHQLIDPKVQLEVNIKQLSQIEIEKEIAFVKWQSECKTYSCDGSLAKQLENNYKNLSSTYTKMRDKGSADNKSLNMRNAADVLRKYEEIYNQLAIQEAIYKYLRQMYEQSLLEENDKIGRFEVIEKPWVNKKRVAPPRRAIVTSLVLADLVIAILICAFLETYQQQSLFNGARYQVVQKIKASFLGYKR